MSSGARKGDDLLFGKSDFEGDRFFKDRNFVPPDNIKCQDDKC